MIIVITLYICKLALSKSHALLAPRSAGHIARSSPPASVSKKTDVAPAVAAPATAPAVNARTCGDRR